MSIDWDNPRKLYIYCVWGLVYLIIYLWINSNKVIFFVFMSLKQQWKKIVNKSVCNWLDEKHILSSDCVRHLVQKNPVFGYLSKTLVDEDFRESFNIFACITANPNKEPIVYVLIMYNTAIHTGKATNIFKDLLWNIIINGKLFTYINYQN